jgi:hypothetical protein
MLEADLRIDRIRENQFAKEARMMNSDIPDLQKIGRGIANFSRLRNEGYAYVDKTQFVHKILTGESPYIFLSRPRRFGKTLLVDTLEEAAAGRKELFKGLAIDSLRDTDEWPRSHVLRIGMSRFGDDPALLDCNLADFLQTFASRRGFAVAAQDSPYCLTKVISALSWNYADIPIITDNIRPKDALTADRQKIIVLIDEYDAPIINNITNPQKLDVAKQILHSFYNALKSCEDMIERIFITGITKFSQLSVFSAMNNLVDITFDPQYGTVCGFTIDEIKKYYSYRLDVALSDFQNKNKFGPGFTRESLIERIIEWYDGYSWNGNDRVLNPLSLQNFLADHVFDNFWIRSGGMNFLNQMNITDDIFSEVFNGEAEFNGSLDIQDTGNIDPVAVMLQTGYLTVRKQQETEQFSELYLAVPNKEVGMTIMRNYVDDHVIPSIIDDDNFTPALCKEFCTAFFQGQSKRSEELLQSFLSSIPYKLHLKMEALYHVFLFSIFRMSGFKTQPEQNIAKGIVDLVIKSPEYGYMVTEIKYAKSDSDDSTASDAADDEPATAISANDERKLDSCVKAAFKQILKMNYLSPYIGGRNPVHAVAVAVCGRNHVRIRSYPAKELLMRAREFSGDAGRTKTGPVTPAARVDEPPQKSRPTRNRRHRQ